MIDSSAKNFAFHVGRSVGRYKLESLLGRGAMAEVYKSTHPDLDRDIAVKILHPFHTQLPGFIGRFRLEAQAAASLHHPNIVQVYDFAVTDDGLYYMVMQYINGLSLEEYLSLEKSPLSLSKSFLFFRQIANALQFAHQRGTIHRDVKPANIMLDTRENAYLSDFGLAKIVGVDHQTLSGMNPGTPSYMAPEHISGKQVTTAVDIYALGVILYRILTNRLPYEGDNLMTVITRTLTEPPTPPREYNSDIPQTIEEIILKAMSENPQERFANAATMSRALADAMAAIGEAIPVGREGAPVGVIPLPGLQLDNYKVKREFIRDNAGVSRKYYQRYLAYNVALENTAVLTVLKTPADQKSNFITRFHQRMDKLVLLDHPGIAAITRVDKTPSNQPYVAYEYVPGNTLEDELVEWHKEENRLPVVEALKFIQQVADPLAEAHKVDIVHNDLRPENIIIQEDGTPVLVGLEIPVAPDAWARSDAVKVLDYASPEQLEGNLLGEQSNVYSLGVILYEILAGHRPILDWDKLDEAFLPQPAPLDGVRKGLAAETNQFVQDCLRRDEDGRRIDNTSEFIERVDQAIVAEAALQEKSGWLTQRRRYAYTAVPVSAIAIIMLAFFFIRGKAPSLVEISTPTTIPMTELMPIILTPSPIQSPTYDPSPTSEPKTAVEFTGTLQNAESPEKDPTHTPSPIASPFPSATHEPPPNTPTALPTPGCEMPEDWVIYTVKQGDVLFTLAFEFGMTFEKLQEINCLNNNILSIGQQIWLPSFPATATPTITITPSPTPRPQQRTATPTRTPPPPPDTPTPLPSPSITPTSF